MSKFVTGIITTYKREADMVEKAIKSMLLQSPFIKEVIVVDDNANDSLYSEELKKLCLKFSLVKYIKNNGNKGACFARNLGICNANGDFVAFLDDDDEWLPNKIEKQLALFDGDPSIGMVFSNGILRRNVCGKCSDEIYNKHFVNEPTFSKMLEGDYVGSTSHPLIKKTVFENVGLFWENQPARQDYEMWIRISKSFRIVGVPDKLFVHEIHDGDQISKNKKKSYVGFVNIYKRYKKYYRINLKAENSILNKIKDCHQGFSLSYFRLFLRHCFVRFRLAFKR